MGAGCSPPVEIRYDGFRWIPDVHQVRIGSNSEVPLLNYGWVEMPDDESSPMVI
jgi:hypothetical protein